MAGHRRHRARAGYLHRRHLGHGGQRRYFHRYARRYHDTAGDNEAEQNFLDKVVSIYQQNTGQSIDETALQTAIDQAGSEIRTDAIQARLQELVTEGKLTQDQADQILSWWQSMPDVLSGGGAG